MFRNASLLLATLLLTITVGCQSEPVAEAVQPAHADTEAQLLQLLVVNADGTVAVTEEAKAAQLIGSGWPAAQAELASLNRRIRSGETSGFHATTDLARYTRHQPSYQPKLDETGEANFTASFSDPRNPQCTMKCIEPGTCCCSSLWIFCWGTCTCRP